MGHDLDDEELEATREMLGLEKIEKEKEKNNEDTKETRI